MTARVPAAGARSEVVGLFETLGHQGHGWRHRDRHRERMAAGAAALGVPFDPGAFDRALDAVVVVPGAYGLVRLDLDPTGTIRASLRPMDALPHPIRLVLSPVRVDAADARLRHKTTWRAPYDAALAHALGRGADDGVLRNTAGEVTETSRFNLFAGSVDGVLRTPPLSSGVLPGVLRSVLLEEGRAVEQVLRPSDLVARPVWVGNSARGLLPARWMSPGGVADPLHRED